MRSLLLHPGAPLAIGTLAILGLLSLLLHGSAAPGALTTAHARVPRLTGLDGCEQCHTENGMTPGCLHCHREIRAQLDGDSGYHSFLEGTRGSECVDCHSEHHGPDFAMVNELSWGSQVEASFRHPHVEFSLEGAHEILSCSDCHRLSEKTALPGFDEFPRGRTLLGADQECTTCHPDEHSDGLTGPCLECHDQHDFKEPRFDHSPHLSLAGGHDGVFCDGCHNLPSAGSAPQPLPFPFEETRGTTCKDCHGTPHRARWGADCTGCHAPAHEHWLSGRDSITPEVHAQTGFTLSEPHTGVTCDGCHPSELPFAERHPDPDAPGYLRRPETCEGCHEDIHEGQFEGKHDHCTDCHSTNRFHPIAYGHEEHRKVFDLSGAHSAIACSSCHELDRSSSVRTFVGTTSLCKDCHEDPHAGQFREALSTDDCSQCHSTNADRFLVEDFDHDARTGFDLLGAHGRAACSSCHRETTVGVGGFEVTARRFSGTPHACADCHIDVHRGQFADYESCDVCHTSHDRFDKITFDHTTQTAFPRTSAHAAAPCSSCHKPEMHADGVEVVRYEPIPHQCGDCHDIEPKSGRK